MAVAYKVAGNSSGRTYHSAPHGSLTLGPIEKKYMVRGVWPRYKVGVIGDADFDGWTICWGKRNLQAHLVSLRILGFKPHSPRMRAK